MMAKDEEVHFWDATSETIKTGSILYNDPFLESMTVTAADEEYSVKYSNLRSGEPLKMPPTVPVQDDDSGDTEPTALPPPPKKIRPSTRPQEMSEVDMISVVECDETEVVPLDYVPCINGILKVGSVAFFADEDWTVIELQFIGSRKKAIASLQSVKDQDSKAKIPAVKVSVKDADLMKTEVSLKRFIFLYS